MIALENQSAFTTPDLAERQFKQVSRMMHRYCGIVLQPGKEGLVKSRLASRLHRLGISSFEKYLNHIASSDGREELTAMIDALTTNKTSFFREPQHFDLMRRRFLPEIVRKGQAPCIWSAGCSSGEEPYSLAMTVLEELPALLASNARILATDISTRMLKVAGEAVYRSESVRGLPSRALQNYFTRLKAPEGYRVNRPVRQLVRFAHLNLVGSWPMKGPFDAIFCRNVMIYFDRETQQELVERFAGLLRPGGYLCVGHSESVSASDCGLRYVRPAVYVKEI